MSKRLMAVIDRMSIPMLFLWMCVFLLLFAFIYWLLGFYGAGLISKGTWVSFPNCIYFSIVTFTSLGYGDISPDGVGKVFACVEVILGLAFLGIFIAKLTSSRQSYHLAQLYARDSQQRLDTFANSLHGLRDACRDALETLKREESLPRSLARILADTARTIGMITAYVSFEIENGDFLSDVPKGAITRLLRRCAQLVLAVAPLACFPKSMHSQSQRKIAIRCVRDLANIGSLVKDNSNDESAQSEADNLLRKCLTAEAELMLTYENVARSSSR